MVIIRYFRDDELSQTDYGEPWLPTLVGSKLTVLSDMGTDNWAEHF